MGYLNLNTNERSEFLIKPIYVVMVNNLYQVILMPCLFRIIIVNVSFSTDAVVNPRFSGKNVKNYWDNVWPNASSTPKIRE